ncbi:ABC transporter substrate-binding protein [Streptomyces sp. TP-A0874]|uniref:ABC transporter substrate-binding protein n=1 Tax=Streptomyces sp. TP-A0874 TaxID=549819 RepID=UPI000853631C|nr:extracellular solute-binding protein [Streptomyces sp. TP-A0874]
MAVATASTLALTAAACGGDGDSDEKDSGKKSAPSVELPDLKGQKLQVGAVWTGAEEKNFRAVLDEFEERTGAKVSFVPTGDSIATYLSTKIEGGSPPDVAMLPQVGALRQFAEKGWIKPVSNDVQKQLDKNYSDGWRDLGTYKDKQYGVYFKVANKSLIWYNTAAFENAGVSEPKTWKEFLEVAKTVSASGVAPVSVGGEDGWTLTDWFENVYLSQAGPEKYDQLADHEIKWTDPSVGEALETLGELFGDKTLIAGGQSGALQTSFPKSVTQTFTGGDQPKAAMVYEGDFVAGNISADTDAEVGKDAKVFPFPAVGENSPVVSGGDVAVALKDTEGAQALMTFLASTDAAEIWAEAGGFISPNKELDLDSYTDEVQRDIAEALIEAGDDFRFDMSDQAPAAFGGTKGEGEWKALQDFLKNPKDVKGAQQQLEAAAAKAYKN